MNQTLVRVATTADRPRVIDTIVTAFAADPAFEFFFDDQATFDEMAPSFAGLLFDLRVGRETAWVTDDCDAVALWNPPSGTRPAPERIDIPDFGAAGTRMDFYEDRVHGAIPDEPHWYLGVLASHPRRRGEGLARAVAAAGLDAARSEGVNAYLETVTATNVAIYERAGWTLYDELHDVGGLHVRIMEYDPSA